MKFFNDFFYKKKITIKEVNKYLDVVVEELKKKHEKVTHEDFDNELEALTGIRWKQVKNYKNHPTPGQEIQDNSKIKFFVYEQRKKDKLFKIKHLLAIAGMCFGAALLLYSLFKPTEVIKEVTFKSDTSSIRINPKLMLKISGLANVQIGMDPQAFTDLSCKTLELERLLCHIDLPESNGNVSLFFQHGTLTRLTLTTSDEVIYEDLRSSLDKTLTSFTKKNEKLSSSLETISYISDGEKISFSHLSADAPINATPKVFLIELSHSQ